MTAERIDQLLRHYRMEHKPNETFGQYVVRVEAAR